MKFFVHEIKMTGQETSLFRTIVSLLTAKVINTCMSELDGVCSVLQYGILSHKSVMCTIGCRYLVGRVFMFCVRPSAEPWCQCLGFVVSGCLHVLMFYIIHTCKTVNTRTGGNKNIDLFFYLLLK